MGEVVDFGEFKRRREQEKAAVSEAPAGEELFEPIEGRTNLWSSLTELERETCLELVRLARLTPLDDGRMEEQRRALGGWSDEEVLNFTRNPDNLRILKSKPHFVIALYERITGRI